MYIRIITETRPTGWLLYEEEARRDRQAPASTPWLGLAGVEEDPRELHIVRGID
ncbi:hypothetical protein ACQEWB_40045 [Streptomyces sp. CA-249302]|uniref:hypothetical protein n=1 Tax=Streptomyces sp. CA-249302 TaxID=3240058 RepID=UPI003D8E388E